MGGSIIILHITMGMGAPMYRLLVSSHPGGGRHCCETRLTGFKWEHASLSNGIPTLVKACLC